MENLTPNNLISLPATQSLKVAVISNTMYLDPSLMIDCISEGSDFMKDLSARNIIGEFIKPILDEVLSQILTEKPDLLLIPGGLTFNGEKISHEALVKILKNISKQDIKVFVIPDFRDIDNPGAKAYYGNGSTPTPSISATEFEKPYEDFVYIRSSKTARLYCKISNWKCRFYIHSRRELAPGAF